MQVLLAGLPILLILVLMLGAGWSATKAGLAGLVSTLLVAWFAYGFGQATLADYGVVGATGGAFAEAGWSAGTILWIIFPALCIHQLQQRSGGLATLQDAMGRLSASPVVVALLIAWFFALFIEGAAGFGTAVALAAPFLVSAGFDRVQAVVIALIGHSVGVSFGAVGTPVMPIVELGFDGREISSMTSIYHGLLGWVMLLIVLHMVTPAGQPKAYGLLAMAAFFFLAPMVLLAWVVGPELPTLGGALIGGLLFAWWVSRRQKNSSELRQPFDGKKLLIAGAPYLILVALVLLTRLIPGIQYSLKNMTIGWSFGETFRGSFAPLYHPGSLLFISFLLGSVVKGISSSIVLQSMLGALKQVSAVVIALLTMLALSRVMVHSSMIETLAVTTASLTGAGYPMLAPFVGVLGTFVTGSATASNILFSDFQVATAAQLEMAETRLLGAQNFGAAVGNIICPHNIIAASATVSLGGQEGKVLRGTLGPTLLYAFLGGIVAMVLVSI